MPDNQVPRDWKQNITGIIQCFFGLYSGVIATLAYWFPQPIPGGSVPQGVTPASTAYSMPWYLWLGIMGLTLSVIVPAIVKTVRGRTISDKSETGVLSVGGDNKGRMLQTSSIGIYNEAPAPPPPPLPKPPPPPITFDVHAQWVEIVYDMSPGVWRESTQFDYDKDPKMALVISITRPAPPKGAVAHKELPLVAIIKFTHEHGESQVSRAYWLNHIQHELNFGIGHPEGVIVGRLEGQSFASYINAYQHETNGWMGMEVPVRPQGARVVIPANKPVQTEVSLFNCYAKATIEQRRFVLGFNENGRRTVQEES